MYTQTIWKELSMSPAQKVVALNNLENMYGEGVAYINAITHGEMYYDKNTCDAKYFTTANDGSGSNFVALTIDGYSAQQIIDAGTPSGCIAIWSGSVASIPTGWHLCDGTLGTVDLRSDFVYGAGTVAVGTTGTGKHTPTGTVTVAGHALTVAEIQNHRHAYNDYFAGAGGHCAYVGSMECYSTSQTRVTGYSSVGKTPADEHTHSTAEGTAFIGTEFTAQPPYYALAFIQKI